MASKESLLFCDGKEQLTKLCTLFNKAALDESDMGLNSVGLKVIAAGRIKKSIEVTVKVKGVKEDKMVTFPMMWTTGSCFVWCNRKDEPRADDWWGSYMVKLFAPNFSGCFSTSIDSVSSPFLGSELRGQDMPAGMKEGCPGEYRENEWVKVFYPDGNAQFDLSLINGL